MTPTEAYELTLDKIEELKKEGISIRMKIPDSANDKSLVEKHRNNPNGVPPEKWISINFYNITDLQADRIFQSASYLGVCGITFDCGGYKDTRDWELDWSFCYSGIEDGEWMEAREEIESRIRNRN